ncbi:YicC/YloC family endoribonuclease [Caloramator fervidus]|nr:YicC/YloC family endoribonuclease [Caloramator fervidus]
MIKSMTGYGRGEVEENNRKFVIELKSVNNRYLDVNIRLPKQLLALEDNIRKYISSKISRGKVDVFINQEKFADNDIKISLDEKVAQYYYNVFMQLKEKFNLSEEIGLSLFTKFSDIIIVEKNEEDYESIWETMKKALDQALSVFIDMRIREGLKLKQDILEKCNIISQKVDEIERRSPMVVEEYKEKIRERISEFLKDVEVDETRLLNEVAFFADKVNINEEIIRLKSHIEQLKNTLESEEAVGRKLDFLLQEMNRETNTIGSKANDLVISNLVIDIKSELEKIREQIQNIE